MLRSGKPRWHPVACTIVGPLVSIGVGARESRKRLSVPHVAMHACTSVRFRGSKPSHEQSDNVRMRVCMCAACNVSYAWEEGPGRRTRTGAEARKLEEWRGGVEENGREKLSGAWPLELAAPALELSSSPAPSEGRTGRRITPYCTGSTKQELRSTR
eukprot:scaffold568_cov98-Isochrysis_galbana.AAC.2